MRRGRFAELRPEVPVTFDVLVEELRATRSEPEAPDGDRDALLFDRAPVGYAVLEPNGSIQRINQLGATLLGKAPPQLVGAQFQGFLAFRDRPAFADLLARSLEREARETCEVALTKRGEIPLAAQLTARALARERIVLLAFEDITERRHRERLQRRTEHALRAHGDRRDEVLAALAHELRNPLAPIRNGLFLLSHVDAGDDRAAKARAIIDRQVRLLARVIDDLLDTTRVAPGKVRLPTLGPANDEPPAPEPAAKRQRRVLVIDDNSDNRDALQYALELSGHDVRVAPDGAKGIELARQFRPEIVVSDLGMPGMDGYAIARAFKANQGLRPAYLLAVSGHSRPEDIARAAEAGFDQHLSKPVMLEDLERLIREAPVRKARRRPGAKVAPRLKLHSSHY